MDHPKDHSLFGLGLPGNGVFLGVITNPRDPFTIDPNLLPSVPEHPGVDSPEATLAADINKHSAAPSLRPEALPAKTELQLLVGWWWFFTTKPSEKIWVSTPRIGVSIYPPNHPFVHRVFHYFHHPFWGVKPPLFLETLICSSNWIFSPKVSRDESLTIFETTTNRWCCEL